MRIIKMIKSIFKFNTWYLLEEVVVPDETGVNRFFVLWVCHGKYPFFMTRISIGYFDNIISAHAYVKDHFIEIARYKVVRFSSIFKEKKKK